MAIPCFNGDPTDEETRMAIWKWAKPNLIDKGMPFEKVAQAINDKYFQGAAPRKLIADILGGRKTPLQPLVNDMWRARNNRRQITLQAQALSKHYATPAPLRALQSLWESSRFVSTLGHWATFPGTHAGMLAMNVRRWGAFGKIFTDTYKMAALGSRGLSAKAFTEKMLDDMEKDDLYPRSMKGKLDVATNSRPDDIVSKYLLTSNNPGINAFMEGVKKYGGINATERAWDALKVGRFNLWKDEFMRHVKPGMTEAQLDDLSARIAKWSNHATGSAQFKLPGMREQLPGSSLLFGPKLFASKWARLVSDPAETLGIVAKWASRQPVSAGEAAVAKIRISGAATMAATYAAMQAANYGINKWAGVKDQDNVNMFDPSKSDWLNFKAFGMQIGPGGLFSELRFLGKVLSTQLSNDPDEHKSWKTVNAITRYGREHLAPQAQIPFEAGSLIPGIGSAKISGVPMLGTDAMGRPVPWSPEKGAQSGFFKKMDYPTYALSKIPIPLTGPSGMIYDAFREKGMNAMEASGFMRGLLEFGLGFHGFHAHEEPAAQPKPGPQFMPSAPKASAAPRSHHARTR